ncbi:ankyrin repeat and fibronectin type-III domain-containing protein 1 [Trichonephila clavipes]|nr:ankyrin repeat and fibronectin type-III domain-containing protein 1 [Trichonephila clavipes]
MGSKVLWVVVADTTGAVLCNGFINHNDFISVNSDGFTPLDIAVMIHDISMAKLLQSYGARESTRYRTKESKFSQLLSLVKEAERCVDDLTTCVLSAATCGSLSMALLKEKEKQLTLWRRRQQLLWRMKSGFEKLKTPSPPTSVTLEVVGTKALKVKFAESDSSREPETIVTKYKDNLVALHFKYDQARRRFVEWAQNEIAVVPDFHKRILFSDEAHFWLNGYVNKQNCRIWSEANPQVYVETPLHPEKLTVWCALWAGGIIGPYFFKNDEGHNVTVNDGATCHTARATIDLLKDTFGDRLISRFGPVNGPPRSCDLTPLDYFLWGYVKSLVYADKPQTLDHLEDNIRRVIADRRPQMLEKVIENWTSRLDYIRASRGSPMPEIIFKM